MSHHPRTQLESRSTAYGEEASRLERHANAVSFGRLLTFGAAVVLIGTGVSQGSTALLMIAGAMVVAFFGLVFTHARILARRDGARTRQAATQRHLERLTEEWMRFPSTGDSLLDTEHDYSGDIDLVGPGSLFQRIDTTHTVSGAQTLARWLGSPADPETIRERQDAVYELSPRIDFRIELEASARTARGDEKLDPSPFLQFADRNPFVATRPALIAVIFVLPVVTLGLYVAGELDIVPDLVWLAGLVAQILVVLATGPTTKEALDLVAARRGYLEAFQQALLTIERERFESELLTRLHQRICIGDRPPSRYLARLDRWAGLADLRTQFPLNIIANFGLLWDLHVLYQLERWNQTVGTRLHETFRALGEVETLAALATLAHLEPASTRPVIEGAGSPFVVEGLAHPLLVADGRIANDLTVPGEGTALIVTGSNMAGKSTLLRAVGLNIALALAGGPVIAKRLSLPVVRLRASMRAHDSLQRGASYFHAELQKLRVVVREAEQPPPVFFLLDELLRGTNARARHLGARAVVLHLLGRRAMGLVATHDIALSDMEQETRGLITNVHFTDVMKSGEMMFDYLLRPGVVQTSNALRLLQMAGIEVDADDALA